MVDREECRRRWLDAMAIAQIVLDNKLTPKLMDHLKTDATFYGIEDCTNVCAWFSAAEVWYKMSN